MNESRREQLLSALAAMPSPVSGEDLARRLGVTSRSVRTYVRQVNSAAGRELISTSHRGYRLTGDGLDQIRHRPVEEPHSADERLATIYRRLLLTTTPVSIHDLAASLYVSESTVEATLTRAREQLRDSGLALVRDHEYLSLQGSERLKRRFMRQLIVRSAQGLNPRMLKNFANEYPDFDLGELRRGLQAALSEAQLNVNEYVLTDIVMHVTIAADRVQRGHTLAAGWRQQGDVDPTRQQLMQLLSRVVEESLHVRLSDDELQTVYGLVTARAAPAGSDPTRLVRPEVLRLTKEIVADVADHFLLGLDDDQALTSLALHVQNLIQRARSGEVLSNPLGVAFKNSHPLVHELALYFSRQVEARVGIVIGPGEVDFLAFHLGSQFLRSLDSRQRLEVTLVVPRYNQMQEMLAERLTAALEHQADVVEVITSLDHDWSRVDSDLVVTVVDLAGQTSVPTVMISPFGNKGDLEKVSAAIQREHLALTRQRVRSTIAGLVDPALFHHVAQVEGQEHALRLMADELVAQGFVGTHFITDVLDREHRSSTAFGGRFAIPHSMFMDANHTAISILVSDREIPWGESPVRLVALFALSPDSRHLFRDVLDEFIIALNDQDNIEQLLRAAGSHEEFIRALERVLEVDR